VLLALTPGCTSNCYDDGFAWSQSKEECAVGSATATESATDSDTTTATDSDTVTATVTVTNPTTDSDTGTMSFCRDADMDDQGDPNDCVTGSSAPEGYVANDEDCDDSDANTFTGAAQIEDVEACMTDVDDDGWGEMSPADGVTEGTDCKDDNPSAFPGAAEIEDPEACMEDEDDDGWGDDMPDDGVDAGTDCIDADPKTYPGAAGKDDPASCQTDSDGDGYGDPEPPPGSTPGSDCDDEDAFTFPGAAPNDDAEACMKDSDEDDYGDFEVPEGVVPGSDCDDSHGETYPGAAENDVPPGECMRDDDGDGYGDNDPENANVTAGNDCDDTDVEVFESCSNCEPDEKFCMGDELYVCNGMGNGSELEEICDAGCDMEKGACVQVLSVDAGPSVCIDPGASAQLQAMAMGGDGAYLWDWTPADTLDDAAIDNPLATPANATTYTVTVTDGADEMASDDVSVFIKDAALVLDDVSCKITNFGWGGLESVDWDWNPDLVELCQVNNSSPTARFCGWSLSNANLQGRFEVKTGIDDDYLGFLWGIQPFDQMAMEPEQFYFMSWKQGEQLGFCGDDYPDSGREGIIIKRIDVKDANNAPLTCADFHDPHDTENSVVLADEMAFTEVGWDDKVAYVFDLTHTPTGFTVKVLRDDDNSLVAEKEFVDDTYPNGQVGFYAYSQQKTCFSNFKTNCL